jgi:hypothetical protein
MIDKEATVNLITLRAGVPGVNAAAPDPGSLQEGNNA